MAKTGQKSRKASPMLTKNGNTRLGPLNIAQLTKMLEGARKKHIPKIQRALIARAKTQQVSKKIVEEENQEIDLDGGLSSINEQATE
jgi:hypothetical protein